MLLGSTKHGVVFPDPAAGQSDRNLIHLAKPWESLTLSSVMVELVLGRPGERHLGRDLLEGVIQALAEVLGPTAGARAVDRHARGGLLKDI